MFGSMPVILQPPMLSSTVAALRCEVLDPSKNATVPFG